MAATVKTALQSALVNIFEHFLTPASKATAIPEDNYFRPVLVPAAAYGDGYILATYVAMLLAVLSESDLCIAGIFGAGKTRAIAVMGIALTLICLYSLNFNYSDQKMWRSRPLVIILRASILPIVRPLVASSDEWRNGKEMPIARKSMCRAARETNSCTVSVSSFQLEHDNGAGHDILRDSGVVTQCNCNHHR